MEFIGMAAIPLIQQPLVVKRKSKNLAVVQSLEAGCLSRSSVCAGILRKRAPVPVKG